MIAVDLERAVRVADLLEERYGIRPSRVRIVSSDETFDYPQEPPTPGEGA